MFWVGVGKSVFFLSEIYFWCIGQVIHFEHDRALFKSELQDFLDEHSQQHISGWVNRLVVHTVSALCIYYRHLLITMMMTFVAMNR